MKKLKIGIVGCGGIAACAHIPAYMKMDNVEIVAYCDIVKEKAENFVNDYKWKNAKAYSDFYEFIKDPEIESVDLCVPNYLHSTFAVEAFKNGKHVFSEKPDAVSVEEAEKMKAASEAAGKKLMVMRNNRHTEATKYIKKYIEDGKAGDLYCGHCGWIRRRGIPGKGGWFTTKAQSGGGPLIDLGVHMIDLAIYLMGNPTPVSVSGCTYNKFADNTADADSEHAKFGEAVEDGTFDVEDLAMGFIRFDNGACLQIEFSWASNIENEVNFVELRGSKSGFRWEWGGSTLKIFTEENGELKDIRPELPEGVQAHEANLRHYVDFVLNDAEPDFVPQQGINMIKILTAMYESAKTGKEVRLD